jgi:DNA-binding NarL/FixJ family response regulator
VDPLVELLGRQVDFLLRQPDSAAFLIQVEPFLSALRTEPRLAAYLDDVLEEVVQVVDDMEDVDRELTSELLGLRRELVELRPEADDSHVKPPSGSDSVKTSGSTATAIRAALTERELEIFTQLASGNSNHQIAHDLSVSTNTVANHIASILAKHHLENRIQAAVQAVRSGIS